MMEFAGTFGELKGWPEAIAIVGIALAVAWVLVTIFKHMD